VGDVLFAPPFAEEMNRSRRMATLLAQALAARGWGSLVLDLYGTGDSDGEFADGRIATWRDDLARGYDWLAARGTSNIGIVALRFGALLAAELCAARSVSRLVLWQPAASGEQMLTQFLRIRLAAGLTTGQGETTTTLRERLAAGDTLEIAGYPIVGALAAAMDAMRLDVNAPPRAGAIHWFDLVAEDGRALTPGSARLIDGWRGRGASIDARAIKGDAFWALLETTVAPKLIESTAAVFA
jgi:exosortase A-associated hydrolase 2